MEVQLYQNIDSHTSSSIGPFALETQIKHYLNSNTLPQVPQYFTVINKKMYIELIVTII